MAGFCFAQGRKPPVTPRFTAWMVYWDEANSQKALLNSLPDLDEISIFAYNFDMAGHVVPATDEILSYKNQIPPALRKRGQRFLYTVVNDQVSETESKLKDADVVHRAIGTPQARAAHIAELVALCAPVDGLDIDYERLDPMERDAFTQFIQELGIALHKRHKWLSVVVQPRTAETRLTNQSGAGVIDWKGIVHSVDEIKVMAYMFHYETSAPGSITPLSWLSSLASYAQTIIPRSKLCIVLHLGGFDWPAQGNAQPLEFSDALSLAAAHHVSMDLDPETGSAHFTYAAPAGIHTVWVEEEKGVALKIKVLAAQGIRQVGFWRLGTGDPQIWKTIKVLDSLRT